MSTLAGPSFTRVPVYVEFEDMSSLDKIREAAKHSKTLAARADSNKYKNKIIFNIDLKALGVIFLARPLTLKLKIF